MQTFHFLPTNRTLALKILLRETIPEKQLPVYLDLERRQPIYAWPTSMQSGDPVEGKVEISVIDVDLKSRTIHSLNTWNVARMRMM
ncbi:hypothetical protein T4B_4251 [Trichinella pseudospiralis]|uniref:Uncharacterized protein n=1 Tax=Trichinella pseudospiralis TaxID=6337 RepID=A0A0V1ISI0_TRIPS|nr:hypothetical protein T4B_4251 [Trichinella pseudospiralis]